MARTLIVVKHAMPALEPGVPSRDWRLSDMGRAQCIPLAAHLAAYTPTIIAASAEPKATETGRIVAERLAIPIEIVADLHENDRTDLGWLGSDELEATIARFFAERDQRIMGNETADEAEARFAATVADIRARHPHGNIIIVAHGTVITLFVARRTGLNPFPFWKRLGLPSFVVLSLPGYAMQRVVAHVDLA
ncbi:MAG: phosphoglycerate mutase family protein [Chloroflexota bacterium]|nr:phosphoglycerate mutase family protein [Chloroflexota bacterium]